MKTYLPLVILSVVLFTAQINYAISGEVSIQEVRESLPEHIGTNNMGTEFHLAFIPPKKNNTGISHNILIFSLSDTKVTLSIPATKFLMNYHFNKYKVYKIDLSEHYINFYKSYKKNVEPAQVWKEKAIIIKSEEPLICNARVMSTKYCGAYTAIPKSALGTKYVVSSYAKDSQDSTANEEAGYVAILAPYPNTEVTFILGGNDNTYVPNIKGDTLFPGKTTVMNEKLNNGDVWLIPAMGKNADLSGSLIYSNNPVAVISGVSSARIPDTSENNGYLIEQELPVKTWGKKYHLTPFWGKSQTSYVKIYASEENTHIYKNGKLWKIIDKIGGTEEEGAYLHEKIFNQGDTLPITISSNKPIYVTHFQSGNLSHNPFQTTIIPEEAYQNEYYFISPHLYSRAYVNINYSSPDFSKINISMTNESLNIVEWKDINDPQNSPIIKMPGSHFNDESDYYFTSMTVQPSKVYRLKSDEKMGIQGFDMIQRRGYGLPLGMLLKDLSVNDDQKPVFEYETKNFGREFTVNVFDEPREYKINRSNLRNIYFIKEHSKNFNFDSKSLDNLIGGVSASVSFKLNVINPFEDASAFILAVDAAGNETMHHFTYTKPKIEVKNLDGIWEFLCKPQGPVTKRFVLCNNEDFDLLLDSILIFTRNHVGTAYPYQGFKVEVEELKNLKKISAKDTFLFHVTFDPSIGKGPRWDKIGLKMYLKEGLFYDDFVTDLFAAVESPCIKVSDIHETNDSLNKSEKNYEVVIENTGFTPLSISDFKFIGETASAFNLVGPINSINRYSPLVIEPDQRTSLKLNFDPLGYEHYTCKLYFDSDAFKSENDEYYDPNCIIDLKTIHTSINDGKLTQSYPLPGYSLSEVNPNPVTGENAYFEYEIGTDNIFTEITIYDNAGNLAATLVNENRTFGLHKLLLPRLHSGVYFIYMKAGEFSAVKKFAVEK